MRGEADGGVSGRAAERRRRARDAAAVLPAVAVVLLVPPVVLVGAGAGGGPGTVSPVVTWIFAVWGALIAAAFVLSRLLAGEDDPDGPPEGPP